MVVLESPSIPSNHFGTSTSMTTYLHCNSCYFRPGMGVQRRFFITNCSHLYCETCVGSATKDKCKVCKSQCSTLCLSGKIPKEVEGMFMDPYESLKKFMKEYQQKVEFQRSHQRRLMKHMTEQLQRATKKMSEVEKMVHQFQQLQKEHAELKSQNNYLKLLLSQKDGHPRSNSRSGMSPGTIYQSPSQLGCIFGKNQGFTSLQQKPGSGSNIAAGRLSVRMPPSGGRMGPIGDSAYTPIFSRRDGISPTLSSGDPLTVPRPIQFNEKD
ncbi:hypothetical protein EGW08_020091 [Elysia chlorotica]|uniref:RING-type domain-containing protein n=1 Tax=Elysia chlorotica TaxID=188477 RepID=A0A433SSC2_ELYCH|nr:hypothetical protein EGW08_020091 [Elysia chlorotica]